MDDWVAHPSNTAARRILVPYSNTAARRMLVTYSFLAAVSGEGSLEPPGIRKNK
jgi:hypothetical protein